MQEGQQLSSSLLQESVLLQVHGDGLSCRLLQQEVKKLPAQLAGAQVSTDLIQEGQCPVLVLDLVEENQKLLESLFTQSAEITD